MTALSRHATLSHRAKRIVLGMALLAWVLAPAARLRAADEHAKPAAAAHAAAEPAHGEVAGGVEHGEKHRELLPDPGEADTWYAALWVVVIFLVLLAVLYPTAWKNVLEGLKKREARIRTDIAEAEAARAKAEQTLREYNGKLAEAEERVRDLIAKASSDAHQIAAQIKAQAAEDAQAIKERNERDIEEAKNRAVAEIYDQAATLATAVAEKILQRNLDANDQRELVNRSLELLRSGDGKTVGQN